MLPGFLLTVGGVILAGILCVIGFLSLGVSVFLALAWLAFANGKHLLVRARNRVQRGNEPPHSSTGDGHPSKLRDLEIPKDDAREKGD